MRTPAARRRWTAADVRALMDETRPAPRYELIDGDLLVTPAPSPMHQRAVRLLQRLLEDYCSAHSFGEVYQSPADLSLDDQSVVQPDLFVVPAHTRLLRDWSAVRTLLLAVEVVSPSSTKHDRGTKRGFYQRMGVPEYWIMDADGRTVERCRPGELHPERFGDRLEWTPAGAGVPLVIDLVRLFTSIWQARS